jgi:hypothetical protein
MRSVLAADGGESERDRRCCQRRGPLQRAACVPGFCLGAWRVWASVHLILRPDCRPVQEHNDGFCAYCQSCAPALIRRLDSCHFGARACEKAWRMLFGVAWRAGGAPATRTYSGELACRPDALQRCRREQRSWRHAPALIRRLDICHFGARACWKAWRMRLVVIWLA